MNFVVKIKKAVIPVAGLGTRFLPITKAMPKEMLPLVDKPAIQYVVEEAVMSGIKDILMITGRNKTALEDYFDRAPFIEEILAKKGDILKLKIVQEPSAIADIHYLRQGDPKGLGHAILKAKPYVGEEPFAVLLGDDITDTNGHLLKLMAKIQHETSGSVIALIKVSKRSISSYGCAEVLPIKNKEYLKINNLIEKPSFHTAPSRMAVIGRYILHPKIFNILDKNIPDNFGELQLTHALKQLIQHSEKYNNTCGVYGTIFKGQRYDTGDKLSYIKAVVDIACKRKDLGPDLRKWLKNFVNKKYLL